MNTYVFKSYATGYSIFFDEAMGTYFAHNERNPDVLYEISAGRHWEYVGSGIKYITLNTKELILEGLKAANQSNEIVKFLTYYKLNNIQPELKGWELPEESPLDNPTLESILKTQNKMLESLEHISRPSELETKMIEAIIDKGRELSTEDIRETLIDDVNDYIKETYGLLPQVLEITTEDASVTISGLFHKLFDKLLKMVNADVPVMLVGPAGSGKNHTLEQVAEALELDFYFSNAITQEYKLTGFIDAHGRYHETEFYKAFKNGGMFFFDEIDASIADALIIVNAAIANGYFDFPNGRIEAHEDFRIVAAANTYGHGADMVYVGRSQLDGATLDRFAVVDFNYDKDVESSLSGDDNLYALVVEIRKSIEKLNLRYTMSTRAIINAKKMIGAGLNRHDAISYGIIKSINSDDLRMIYREGNFNRTIPWFKEFRELCSA